MNQFNNFWCAKIWLMWFWICPPQQTTLWNTNVSRRNGWYDRQPVVMLYDKKWISDKQHMGTVENDYLMFWHRKHLTVLKHSVVGVVYFCELQACLLEIWQIQKVIDVALAICLSGNSAGMATYRCRHTWRCTRGETELTLRYTDTPLCYFSAYCCGWLQMIFCTDVWQVS